MSKLEKILGATFTILSAAATVTTAAGIATFLYGASTGSDEAMKTGGVMFSVSVPLGFMFYNNARDYSSKNR